VNVESNSTSQRIFITGASSGIGLALARHYINEGAKVGLVARRAEVLNELAKELGANCSVYVADVRDAESIAKLAQKFMLQYGVPDVVIANAGVSRGTLSEFQQDIVAFKAVFDTNVLGMLHTFQPFISAMRDVRKGQFVGIASVAGIRGLPGAGAYSASKAAVISYLESLRVEIAPYGIVVTTIAPGYIRTPMTEVNQYKMPFLMNVDTAAKKFAHAIQRKRRFVVIPWQMGALARLMRFIPPILWDWAMRKAPHKERTNWDWL
jgi:short-subunit dehydrogenase